MTITGGDFLVIAQQLAAMAGDSSTPEGEAALRSAISRSYYAAFHHARKKAIELGGFRPKWSVEDHHGVQDALRRTRFSVHLPALKNLRTWRNACDYEESLADNPQQMLSAALTAAARILKI